MHPEDQQSALLAFLRKRISGSVVAFGEKTYDQQRTPWLQVVDQHPAVIVNASDVEDIRVTVQTASTKAFHLRCGTQAMALPKPVTAAFFFAWPK